MTSNVKQCQEELKERKYKTAEDVHRERLLDYKANSMAAADLDQYYKALDRALVRFHQKKMEDINKSIRELWTKTYKGEVTAAAAAAAASTSTAISLLTPSHHLRQDIDNIEIKSEHEGEDSAGRRKQCYRVVMKKGDTTLDMRGRCSAGQKVLASLVIRLALAESLSIGCGVLALDEPTTNLDAPQRPLARRGAERDHQPAEADAVQLPARVHHARRGRLAQSLARNCGGQDEYFKVRKFRLGGSHGRTARTSSAATCARSTPERGRMVRSWRRWGERSRAMKELLRGRAPTQFRPGWSGPGQRAWSPLGTPAGRPGSCGCEASRCSDHRDEPRLLPRSISAAAARGRCKRRAGRLCVASRKSTRQEGGATLLCGACTAREDKSEEMGLGTKEELDHLV